MVSTMAGLAGAGVGKLISNRYRVIEELGTGTNGEVYRVRDEHLNKEVAIKLLEPKAHQPATWDEAQALEELTSQYLLPVFNADIVVGSDIRYITTPLMAGGDLEKVASPFGIDPATAVRWAQQAAYGLERIHAEGMLHRDVKPGNIYLDGVGDVLLGDLGMVVRMDSSGLAPADGTLATVAPEALQKKVCSVATDVYSLAATVFYLLSGQYPSGSRHLTRAQRSDRILTGKFDKLRDVAPYVSQSLGRVVERSLDADPLKRADGAREFGNELASCSHHRRAWRRIPTHPGHDLCFEGGAVQSARPVILCVSPEPRGRVSIEVTLDTGTRLRRHEKQGIARKNVLQTLRSVIRDL